MSNTQNEWTVLSMLEWATPFFEEKGVKSPRMSIEWLLAHVLEIKRLDLYINYDRPLTQDELAILRPLVKRRAAHEPLQYITGEATFYNATLKVDERVLIPRQETEQLVQLIFDEYSKDTSLRVLDIGTGSGCIPIALKMERTNWDVHAIDISEEAIDLAQKNATLNQVDINFKVHSLFEPQMNNTSPFDLIVSNPPYILYGELDHLDTEVKEFEPHLALFCESTASMFKALSDFCDKNLSDNGKAYFEIHEEYGDETQRVFNEHGWKTSLLKDLDEKDRFVVIQR